MNYYLATIIPQININSGLKQEGNYLKKEKKRGKKKKKEKYNHHQNDALKV